MKQDVLSMTLPELRQALAATGAPSYTAGQIFGWLHTKNASSFDEMTNVSKQLRAELNNSFVIFGAVVEKKLVSMYDDTVKYLFSLDGGDFAESVVMKYKYGRSICVSTEIGCNMGCRFCASAMGGMSRRLRASEMLSQVYSAQRDLGEKISHVVLMGMGEPMDNYDECLRFIRLLTCSDGNAMSARHVSLSTSGVVPGIYRLMREDIPLTLSVSLHAPNDRIRSSIMPVNKRWGVDELLRACRDWAKTTSRRVSFEYAMMKGVNDSAECASELASKLRGMLCHVNLIPINEVPGTPFARSSQKDIETFVNVLSAKGIPVTVRRSLGSDIEASCGQLRKKYGV